MFKLKLTVWHKPVSQHARGHFLGMAYDHKSFAAMEAAIRAGCYGPASKTQFWTEYVNPNHGVTLTPFFQKTKGRLISVLPLIVAENWLETAKAQLIDESEINKNTPRRRVVPVKWQLLPYKFNTILIGE